MSGVNKTFVEKVMALLTGGDEGKIKRFQKRGISQLKQSISAMESEIETLTLQRDDAAEAQAEALINVDVDRLTSIESIDTYIVEYLKAQKTAEEKVETITKNIKKVQDKIALAEGLIKKLS
jgi:peptidoglycan hydrolase CwlO-like protein